MTKRKYDRQVNAGLMDIPPGKTPFNASEGVSRGNNPLNAIRVSHGSSRPSAWVCLAMSRLKGEESVVRVSADAIPHPTYGWCCNCMRWTWGDDDGHRPVYGRRGRKR